MTAQEIASQINQALTKPGDTITVEFQNTTAEERNRVLELVTREAVQLTWNNVRNDCGSVTATAN